jgi:hypothetical protein
VRDFFSGTHGMPEGAVVNVITVMKHVFKVSQGIMVSVSSLIIFDIFDALYGFFVVVFC